jgi:hypothetical protein
MWLADLPTPLLPPGPWQARQSVDALKAAWLGIELAQLVVVWWQLSQLPVTVVWTAAFAPENGLVVTAYELLLAFWWHVTHWIATLMLACNWPGFQLVYPPLWQESQLLAPASVAYGMCVAVFPSAGR